MMTRTLAFLVAALLMALPAMARNYSLSSPDGSLTISVSVGEDLLWSLSRNGVELVSPSPAALVLADGKVLGTSMKVRRVLRSSVDKTEDALFFKRSSVRDHYNELKLISTDFDVIFRAYDDGVAYRFVTHREVTVKSETAQFRFPADWTAWVPYVRNKGKIEEQFFNSFENLYEHIPLSSWSYGRLAFLPLTVDGPGGVKLCITESDLLNYPGMYLLGVGTSTALNGVFAPVPSTVEQGGHNMLQGVVTSRKDCIYEGSGPEALPWRVVAVSEDARGLAQSDLVWKLASPAADADWSWVRPGKVAWEWWNSWNVYDVDFRAGINNDTYKYYIDFASAHGIRYVIMDEGWAVNGEADLMKVIPEIDIAMLSSYAISKGVRLILWAGYLAFDRDMENVCRHYANLGIAGWKIDFLDRDDQYMVAFCERAARTAAKYHQVVDFHGVFKPAGLTRTWPNVLNYEAVDGLEQLKWAKSGFDIVTYDVTLPFTRFVAGPADYTQGAMRNATKSNFKAVYSEGMSQGTRCRQLAEYVVFDAPLTMLCDSPSNYLREEECTQFIASVPTVWDETLCLDGSIGEYVVTARRSSDTWYIAGLTNWDERDITLDFSSIIPSGSLVHTTLYRDGINADRAARDYKKEEIVLEDSLTVHLAPGGGFVLVLTPD